MLKLAIRISLCAFWFCGLAPARAGLILNPAPYLKLPKVGSGSAAKVLIAKGGDERPEIWKTDEVFLVSRMAPDPLRPGSMTMDPVGRAIVVDRQRGQARLYFYRAFENRVPAEGDLLMRMGTPLDAKELEDAKKEASNLPPLALDRELGDPYEGLISLKAGMYSARIHSESSNDTNSFKSSSSFFLKTFGLAWWLKPLPKIGINLDFSTGSIPTFGYRKQPEESTQTYLNPGLLYRAKFIVVPIRWSVTYFVNSFKTTNSDDFLISSVYSGPLLGLTAYWPQIFPIVKTKGFAFRLAHVEAGFNYAPSVLVSDQVYVRGTRVNGTMTGFQAGLEFNVLVNKWAFTKNLFFVLEAGSQSFSLQFKGKTQGVRPGTLPGFTALPEDGSNTESQNWFGLRIKYNFDDFIGDLISGG